MSVKMHYECEDAGYVELIVNLNSVIFFSKSFKYLRRLPVFLKVGAVPDLRFFPHAFLLLGNF